MVNFMYYLKFFFLFSILGHFIESFFYSSGESGILLGWWTPIYGIGTLIILFIHKYLDKLKLNKPLKVITLFFACAIFLCLIEAVGGYLIKWLFNIELWNYSNHKFHIGKYTSLEMSLLWGLSSILLIYYLKPLCDKFINKIPNYYVYILSFLLVFDLFATIIIKS